MSWHGSVGFGAARYGMGNIIRVDNDPAWERHVRIVALKQYIEELGLQMGKELYLFQKEKGYNTLGHPSFESYLGSPELAISRRTAYRLIRVYRRWVIELGYELEQLTEAGTTKLDMLAAHVDEGSKDRYLNMAATLSRSDLQAEIDGTEPIYIPVAWRDLLHEARNACELLARSDAPDEVRAFALDFWSATEARV